MKRENSRSRITRRAAAGALLATTAAAQTPPPAQPAPPVSDLDAARQQNQRAAGTLAKAPVPIETEPAFHFTA